MRATLLLVAICCVAHTIVIRQPTHKTASLRAKLIQEGTYVGFLAQQELARVTSKFTVAKQPYSDNLDDIYRGQIAIGTPPQNFTVLVDTGSTDAWVIDKRCKTDACEGAQNGYQKNDFDVSASSTFGQTASKHFDSTGYCSGNVVSDVFYVENLKYSNQGFGLADSVVDYFSQTPVDGFFGLAWPANTVMDTPSPLWNMLDQLDAPLFTIWLDRRAKPTESMPLGGIITYGAFDSEHCDAQVDYVQLSSLTYWQFPMTRFAIGSYSSNTKVQAISQTAAWIGAPTSAVAGMASATGAKYDQIMYLYTLPCTGNYPDMVFTIGGRAYNVPSSEYVIDLGLGGGKCALSVYEMYNTGFGPDWILGYTWIRTYCNVHDIGQKRIGFATAKHTE